MQSELRVHLGVAGLEHADERACGQRRADGLHFGELAAPAEDVEERRGLALDASDTTASLEDDRPRDDREQDQDRENGLS